MRCRWRSLPPLVKLVLWPRTVGRLASLVLRARFSSEFALRCRLSCSSASCRSRPCLSLVVMQAAHNLDVPLLQTA